MPKRPDKTGDAAPSLTVGFLPVSPLLRGSDTFIVG